MAVTYIDGDWTVPTITGPKRWFAPFPDNALIMFAQDYVQLYSSWDDSRTILDTPHDDLPTYYRVECSGLAGLGGDVVRWTETYSLIPEPRFEFESYSYTFPGLESGPLGPLRYISSASQGSVTTINTTVAHGISAGSMVIVKYNNQIATGEQTTRQVLREALSAGGSTLTVSLILDTNIISWISVQAADIGRDPFSEEVNSILNLDYFLPGVSPGISVPTQIPEIIPAYIVDNTGKQTTTYTSTSAPTKAEYQTMIQAETLMVASGSTLRRWRGNIYERVVRYVKAR